jgi:hypothetical protein
MNKPEPLLRKTLAIGLLPLALAACSMEQPVSFSQNVKPTLDLYCLECHREGGAGHTASGLDLSTYEGLMKGTRNGPMVIAGDSLGSNLVVLMEGRADPSIAMPHGGSEKVRQPEIDLIKTWIDQGARNN